MQLMSTFPFFIYFRCSVASICLLCAALFTQFGVTNLGVAFDGGHVYPLCLSLVFMPEVQSGIALGGKEWQREIGQGVHVHVRMCAYVGKEQEKDPTLCCCSSVAIL